MQIDRRGAVEMRLNFAWGNRPFDNGDVINHPVKIGVERTKRVDVLLSADVQLAIARGRFQVSESNLGPIDIKGVRAARHASSGWAVVYIGQMVPPSARVVEREAIVNGRAITRNAWSTEVIQADVVAIADLNQRQCAVVVADRPVRVWSRPHHHAEVTIERPKRRR